MAYNPNTYTADGSTTEFAITFPFLREADIVVSVFDASGNVVSAFDFEIFLDGSFKARVVADGTITDNTPTALPANYTVTISRNTDISTLGTTFVDGVSLRAADINILLNQQNYALQEFGRNTQEALGKNVTDTAWDATNLRITNLAQPTADNDAIRKVDVDSGIGPDITTVAGIASAVSTLAGNDTDGTAHLVNVETLAEDLAGTNTIGTVAGSIASVNAVAGTDAGGTAHLTNISELAPQANNISTLTQSANLTALQNAQANAQAAQAALATFLNKYHGTHPNSAGNDAEVLADIAGDSALTLEEGDLYFDSTNDKLRVYDGSAWQNAASVNVINTSTLSSVGDVAAYSNLQQNDFVVRGVSEWENASPTAARQALGLGTAATTDATAYATSTQGGTADTALQPGDVVNDVTTGGTQAPLSAQQGVELKAAVDAKATPGFAIAMSIVF